DQVTKLLKMRLGNVDPGTAGREVRPGHKVEIHQQAFPKNFDLFRQKGLRVEITAATVASATAVVHVPDGNTECRAEIGTNLLGNALDPFLSVEQVEELMESFEGSGVETIMDVSPLRARIEHFYPARRRRSQFSELLILPLHQGTLGFAVIDPQPYVL